MTKRGVLLVLDTTMLLCYAFLMSWRLTGVVAHEWISVAILALILLHLVVHWNWVESTVASTMRRARRNRAVALVLNLGLFVTMGMALVSGFVISKAILPNHLAPGDYLKWHEVHEFGSNLTLFLLGLHVALNWDRVLSSFRRMFNPPGTVHRWNLHAGSIARRTAWVVGVSAVLTGVVLVYGRLQPAKNDIIMMTRGHERHVRPPAMLARLQRGTAGPNAQGTPKFLISLVGIGATALIGRRVLRLRLSSRPTENLRA